MRVIKGISLGTYYAVGADAFRESRNASGMRTLVYAVKDNRDTPKPGSSRGPYKAPCLPGGCHGGSQERGGLRRCYRRAVPPQDR
jgi:hypothetical protein